MNFVRNFRLGGRRTFQARVDIQNLLNYAAYNNPITDPTNTNFGKVTTAVALRRRDALLQLRREVYFLVPMRVAASKCQRQSSIQVTGYDSGDPVAVRLSSRSADRLC